MLARRERADLVRQPRKCALRERFDGLVGREFFQRAMQQRQQHEHRDRRPPTPCVTWDFSTGNKHHMQHDAIVSGIRRVAMRDPNPWRAGGPRRRPSPHVPVNRRSAAERR